MITLEFLREHLTSINEINNDSQIIESDAGYDGIIEIISNRTDSFPCVVFEPESIGELAIIPGGFNSCAVSLWVMESVGMHEILKDKQASAKQLVKDIISLFAGLKHLHQELAGWDCTTIPYSIRNAGDKTGYELTLYFKDDIDLS